MLLAIAAWVTACTGKNSSQQSETSENLHPLPDTLRVATLYSPTSYFIYRDEPMGYDYALLQQFASDKGKAIDLHVATSLQKGIEMLDSGIVDLLAYEIPVTSEFKQKVLACGPEYLTHQVLVQPRNNRDSLITDETQLVGKHIYVPKNSKYEFRLRNLNEELGGGIVIHTIERDTLIAENLIDMVSAGEIPLTVVDSDIAKINKTYHRDLDISLPLSFDQRSAWGIRKESRWLADSINAWFEMEQPKARSANLLKRYFELSKTDSSPETYTVDFKSGRLSPYDAIFKKHGRSSGIDWRLLAAQAYHESHFNAHRVSWAGARGLMQIMPGTARAYNLPMNLIDDPDANVEASTRILNDLDKSLKKRVPDNNERLKFVIAAYNSGLGHIYDAIALAAKYGKNAQIWNGNVEQALLWKSNPDYYTDPVCKAGYLRGRETVEYVRKVMDFYTKARQQMPG